MAINRANGGVTGVNNKTSSGGNSITRIPASTTFEVQPGTTEVDVLVVAGGGGSGGDQGAGGGGAGGLQSATNQVVSPGSTIPVTVGAGGAAGGTGTPEDGSDGGNSVFNNPTNVITSVGGGGGGLGDSQGGGTGRDGGSGGGGGGRGDDAGGSATSGQGNAGGKSKPQTSPTNDRGGGGGGAGGAGGDGANDPGAAGNGGIGAASSITGTATYFAGGGGGGSESSGGTAGGSGGLGGGGAGGNGAAGTAGTANTGGGGGASGSAPTAGGAGGSGVVIVKEKNKANGVFNMNSQYNAVKRGQWPTIDKTENANVTNSLRFNDDDSPKLSRAVSTSGSSTNATLSLWVKRSNLGTRQQIYSNKTADSGFSAWNMYFNASNDRLYIDHHDGSSNISIYTTQVFRDVGAWYHIVHTIDTTEAESTSRLRVYVNGEEVTDFATDQAPDQNSNLALSNSTGDQSFGDDPRDSNDFFDGYMADIYYIDGLTLPCTHFGEPDSDNPNIWQPKKYIGNFGTNGFHLEFKQSGTSQNSSGLGADTSGNDNHLAVTNLAAIDQTTDTPVNNFATFNSLYASNTQTNGYVTTLSQGNLRAVSTTDGKVSGISSVGVANGKWYAEFKQIAFSSSNSKNYSMVGVHADITPMIHNNPNGNGVQGYSPHGYVYWGFNSDGSTAGFKMNDDSSSGYGDAWGTNDIIGVALDLDNNAIYVSKNGTFQASSDPTSGASRTNAMFNLTAAGSTPDGVYFFTVGDSGSSQTGTWEANFGNPPFSISSGNSDANGFGNFEYAVPSGYYALCTKNLAQYG